MLCGNGTSGYHAACRQTGGGFDTDGALTETNDGDILHRRLREQWLGWLVQKRTRQPLNGLILTLDLPIY
jgi:type VI protein secretion system component VasK